MRPWIDGNWVVGDLYDGGDLSVYLAKGSRAAITVNAFISNMIEAHYG